MDSRKACAAGSSGPTPRAPASLRSSTVTEGNASSSFRVNPWCDIGGWRLPTEESSSLVQVHLKVTKRAPSGKRLAAAWVSPAQRSSAQLDDGGCGTGIWPMKTPLVSAAKRPAKSKASGVLPCDVEITPPSTVDLVGIAMFMVVVVTVL